MNEKKEYESRGSLGFALRKATLTEKQAWSHWRSLSRFGPLLVKDGLEEMDSSEEALDEVTFKSHFQS